MALLGALCVSLNAPRVHQPDRLRRNGLIRRRPGSNTYDLTADGQRVAIFYTKVHNRILRPLIAADAPPPPLELRRALRVIDHHVNNYIDTARLEPVA